MLAIGCGPTSLPVMARCGSAPAPSAPINAVAADGWQASMTVPAELAMSPVSVSRQGFDAAGTAATLTETLLTTKRVRQAYPSHALLTASSVALSDYLYSTDTIAGVANNSTQTSPKPVANWIMPHRLVVGTALEAEVAAFHRNASGGKQVACVVFTASDGANTASATVATPAVSGRSGDRNAVVSYKAVLDIAGLNPGLITLNARVYPRIGAAASVADSAADGNAARGFSPRYFLKNTGARTYAYVRTAANGGNDATGAVSTNAAAASASPFATVLAAINALHNALAETSGVDMGEIRVGHDGGTPFALGAAAATRTQKVAALTVTRDPAVPKANARVGFGATAFRPRLGGSLAAPLTTGAVLFKDVGVVRTGALTFSGEVATQLEVIFDDVVFDNGGFNAAWFSNSHDYHFGTSFTNLTGNSNLGASSNGEHRIFRGIDLQPPAVAGGISVECFTIVGSAIRNPSFVRDPGRSFSGGMVAFSTLTDPPTTSIMLAIGASADVAGFAFVQNVVEYMSATTNAVLRISGDAATGSNSHVILHNNSFAGAFQAGRWNVFYDEGPTRRTSKLQSVVGNIAVAIYTKNDVFVGTNNNGTPDPATAPSCTGNWAFAHGVGCRGNFSQFQSNTPVGGNEAQDFAGLGASIGSSQVNRNDPLFANYQGAKSAGENGGTIGAGAGGGTYSLQAGSPARAMLSDPVLSHGLNGVARGASSDAAGSYAA